MKARDRAAHESAGCCRSGSDSRELRLDSAQALSRGTRGRTHQVDARHHCVRLTVLEAVFSLFPSSNFPFFSSILAFDAAHCDTQREFLRKVYKRPWGLRTGGSLLEIRSSPRALLSPVSRKSCNLGALSVVLPQLVWSSTRVCDPSWCGSRTMCRIECYNKGLRL